MTKQEIIQLLGQMLKTHAEEYKKKQNMAILKGFPPSNTISPTIRIGPNDLAYPTYGYTQDEWAAQYKSVVKKKGMNISCEILEEDDK